MYVFFVVLLKEKGVAQKIKSQKKLTRILTGMLMNELMKDTKYTTVKSENLVVFFSFLGIVFSLQGRYKSPKLPCPLTPVQLRPIGRNSFIKFIQKIRTKCVKYTMVHWFMVHRYIYQG